MRRYILKRHVDRFAPGADVTGVYPVEDLEKWAKEGMVRVVEDPPASDEPVEETPLALDDLAPTAEEPVTAPVEAKPSRKRK